MSKKIEIEDVSLIGTDLGNKPIKKGRLTNEELIEAMKSTQVGQSFVVENIDQNHRTNMSICSKWSGWVFRALKQEDGTYRVGRVK